MVEFRRHPRAPFACSVEFSPKGIAECTPGSCTDISLGGMYVETPRPLPFGTELVVHLKFPGQPAPFALFAIVRWVRSGVGMGLQFRPMGARETHAITELARSGDDRDHVAAPGLRYPRRVMRGRAAR
jgi:hypothetical protein